MARDKDNNLVGRRVAVGSARLAAAVSAPSYAQGMTSSMQFELAFDEGSVKPQRRSNTTAFVDNMVLPVHRWFRYSAGFSAEWAQKTIRDVGASRVVDPFAGSGTTLLAAESENAESIGVDIHPFVARVAKAKRQRCASASRSRNSTSLLIATPACFSESRNWSNDSVLKLPILSLLWKYLCLLSLFGITFPPSGG